MEVKYEKHYILSEFGEKNQKLIQNVKILIVGIGGIGCQVLTQLALNGFENIGLCEYDIVNINNLHRQFIYTIEDAIKKREKIICAEKYILERNKINIVKHSLKITNKNVKNIIKDYEIIIDCTDNIYSRYVLNDACVLNKKIYIFASAIQTSCQLSIFDNKNKKLPCLRCIFPRIDNETCENQGVIGTIPNLIGILTANEVIKYVCNYEDKLIGKFLNYNINSGFYNINIEKINPKCLLCGSIQVINNDNFETLSIYDEICNYKNPNFSITREKINNIDTSCNIIELDDKISLIEYENIYEKLLNNKQTFIFDCKNKIRSKILVHNLREKVKYNKIYYLI